METRVVMPALGESVTEGTVTRWLKNVGDTISVDEPIVEVSTDKVDTEIPSPVAGVLVAISAGVDAVVPVGGELAVIGETAGATTPAAPVPAPVVEVPAPVAAVAAPVAETPAPAVAAPAATSTSAASAAGGTLDVVLPALGESVTEGTVTRWLKNVGDAVTVDEPLVEVSTDKVDTEIPAPVAGTIAEIVAGADSVVPVNGVLARIATSAAAPAAATPAPTTPAPVATASPVSVPAPVAAATPAPAAPAPVAPAAAAPVQRAAAVDGSAPYVTPLVRKLAAEQGIDLSTVVGTGVGGRIRKEDVLAAAGNKPAPAAAAPAPAVAAPVSTPASSPTAPASPAAARPAASPLRGRTEPMTRLRKVIAERMVESLQTSAQLTTVIEVDVTKIARLRNKVKSSFEARHGVKLSFLPFFAKAAIEALQQYPVVNAQINTADGTITYHDAEHLGIAVDTERGLLVPVIRNAGDLNIAGLSRKIADLAERTRTNKVTPDELSGGTFTLTNTGSRGALFDTPIINQPQVGILGTGAVVKRPVVVSDETGTDSIAIRSMVYLALSYDHRLVDGADAARFLVAVKDRLESAEFEAELS
jgi:2-oxoglutarate dehydrogenase E2 component (dihydrolipoamide succinyltransferase)